MKKTLLISILGLAWLGGCAEETLEKTYQCPETYPFFNVYDLRCYSSEEAAQEANKYQQGSDQNQEQEQ